MNPRRIGGVGWLGLALYVVAWDAWVLRTGRETLSTAFGRALQCPARRPAVSAIWLVVTAHLFGRFVPNQLARFDPISAAARRIAREARVSDLLSPTMVQIDADFSSVDIPR